MSTWGSLLVLLPLVGLPLLATLLLRAGAKSPTYRLAGALALVVFLAMLLLHAVVRFQVVTWAFDSLRGWEGRSAHSRCHPFASRRSWSSLRSRSARNEQQTWPRIVSSHLW